MTELLIGCGSNKEKKIYAQSNPRWSNLITLDINSDHDPDYVWDLNNLPLPFPENTFDEIHAYEVLEHVGKQGDYRFFFEQFTEFHRILKNKGKFYATVPAPSSPWAWGDPSHTRIFPKEWLTFLRQQTYIEQVGKTSISDFRYCYKVDYKIELAQEQNDTLYFILEAIKN